jgi:holin-like protein
MLVAFAALLTAQLIGEVVSRGLNLALPGPVIGMLLVLGLLLTRGEIPDQLQRTASSLLKHLSLLFVPAGVGIVRYLDVIGGAWLAISVAIIGSTALTMLVTAQVMRALERRPK